MLDRLTHVIYWTGCGLSILLIALTLYAYSADPDFSRSPFLLVVFLVASVVPFLIGLAVRYIVSGR